jgi:hypothetical protein
MKAKILDIRQVGNKIDKHVDTPEEGGLVEELVVVVQKGGRVRHRGEPDGGNAHLAQVPKGGIRHFIPFPLTLRSSFVEFRNFFSGSDFEVSVPVPDLFPVPYLFPEQDLEDHI